MIKSYADERSEIKIGYSHDKWWYVEELKNTRSDVRSKSYIPYVLRNDTWKPWRPLGDVENPVQPNCPRWIKWNKQKTLPHFALMYRIHLRVLRAVKFRWKFWHIRKWSYHPVLRRTVSILLDLKSHRLGRNGGAPNLWIILAWLKRSLCLASL